MTNSRVIVQISCIRCSLFLDKLKHAKSKMEEQKNVTVVKISSTFGY